VHPIAALQTEYSLWERHAEDAILPTVRELGVGFVAYSPLGRGFLAGGVRSAADLSKGDFGARLTASRGENRHCNLEVVRKVDALAAETGLTQAQLALA
jgi:aryl-alcohol dehydrogenase-like predicted oxidoreductase